MNGREHLVALAESGDLSSLAPAILAAEAAATDDVDGIGEHEAFVRTLIAELGLKRSNTRPRKDINLGPISIVLATKKGLISEREIATKFAGMYGTSPNTIRDRMKEAEAKLVEGRRIFGFEAKDTLANRSIK